jgi:predicted MFS family arabinose efflux permease
MSNSHIRQFHIPTTGNQQLFAGKPLHSAGTDVARLTEQLPIHLNGVSLPLVWRHFEQPYSCALAHRFVRRSVRNVMLSALFPRRRDRAILFPAIGAQLMLGTTMSLLPVFLDTLRTQAGLTLRSAGFLLSAELGVAAMTTLILSTWGHLYPERKWALWGGALAVFGTILSLYSPAITILVASRLLAGVGTGIVGAQALRVLARGSDKERLIAFVTIASILNAALWFALFPLLISHLGYRALYLCLLVVFLAGTALLTRLPSFPNRRLVQMRKTGSRISTPAILVVIAIFLTQLGQGAFWSLDEIYGVNSGFSSDTTGTILAVSTLLLLAGAGGAAWASDRYGRFRTLFLLILMNALAIAMAGTVRIHWVYVAANILQALTNLSSLVYQLSLAADLDRLGRAVAAATAMVTLGNGIGPGLPAWLSSYLGMPSVAVVVLAIDCFALALFSMVFLLWPENVRLEPSLT